MRQSQDRRKADFYDSCWPVAQLTALMANIHRDSKKKADPFLLADFMPKEEVGPKETEVRQTPEQMFMLIRALNARMGGAGEI